MYPKVKEVKASSDYTLLITFDNGKKKIYDFSPLLDQDNFLDLKNIALFKAAQVDAGGYGVTWPNGADISEYALWVDGKEIKD
ncbi:DUF2442 domain-containing protein [Carboxydocella sp. ULO1]|uniref:DUF2442 domain-containing protein n=1 Tax=Carboxydocella sp. ULO1 TaxID=1926599 RepID=UPI0009ABB2A1|nr:DUF2442 domain-containing protein [Carboxydocella sp. ULO1]AVX30380.1 Protein of unknown function (DUF2442) [Carboxydocella thermautotrophica]GAW28013.1 hypothetical protein ULO1_05830 [Carboxydocella sp. ULO1]